MIPVMPMACMCIISILFIYCLLRNFPIMSLLELKLLIWVCVGWADAKEGKYLKEDEKSRPDGGRHELSVTVTF